MSYETYGVIAIVTRDNQFRFKKKHSTKLCIFSVKSEIKYYNLHKGPVNSCFHDASKAYNRVTIGRCSKSCSNVVFQ